MNKLAQMAGTADTLLAYGLTKQAAEVYLSALLEKMAMDGEVPAPAAAMPPGAPAPGGENPFEGMSDEEIVALIQSLPPPIQEEILTQLQGAGAAPAAPAGPAAPMEG